MPNPLEVISTFWLKTLAAVQNLISPLRRAGFRIYLKDYLRCSRGFDGCIALEPDLQL